MSYSRVLLAALAFGGGALAHAGQLVVDLASTRSREEVLAQTDAAVRTFAWNAARLTATSRRRMGVAVPLSIPTRVTLRVAGTELPFGRNGSTRNGELRLVFADSGPRAFSPSYRELLQAVFDRSQAARTAIFGAPAAGGDVLVSNFDADIGDRDAVAGGYYLPNNGSGQPEIRFPVYLASEAAAVNFIHCLLLATVGPKPFFADAFQEGLIRAATMRISRTPSALPASLSQEVVETVLEGTYDAGPYYDWWNHRGLAGATFIPPNLRDKPLPPGGDVGGPYLMRYQMAGTAWAKLLVQYPAFLFGFMPRYYAVWDQARTPEALFPLIEATLAEQGDGTVEGRSFREWFRRQYALDTRTVPGLKLIPQAFPITNGLSQDDFGVFGLQAHYVATAANGDESLLTGRAFPIFWDVSFNRFFTGAGEDRMDFAGGYAAVAPNFPDQYAGDAYRASADVPIAGMVARTYLPAGAIATARRPAPNDVFGTVTDVPGSNGLFRLSLDWGTGRKDDIAVRFYAFGAKLDDPGFLGSRVVVARLFFNEQLVLTRVVAKTPGPLALDLRPNEAAAQDLALPAGISAFGVSIDPFGSDVAAALGLPPGSAQIARYNPVRTQYAFYPECGPLGPGFGFFVRLDQPTAATLFGSGATPTPQIVSLRPGWNLVANPLAVAIGPAGVSVVSTVSFPVRLTDAAQRSVQAEFFEFRPGAPDPFSGVPEGGTLATATVFEPGKAYFVRVFDADGASLLFSTSVRGDTGTSSRRPGWEIAAVLHGPDGPSEVRLGATRSATRGFDPGLDSSLPPGIGGLQAAALAGGERLFRDLRGEGRSETYTVRLEGLRPGRHYRLQLGLIQGRWPRLELIDGKVRRTFHRPGAYAFSGRAESRTLTIRIGGAR